MGHLLKAGPAQRRYFVRLFGSALVYLVTIFVATHTLGKDAPVSGLNLAIALVPGLAVLAMIWAIGRFYVELDDEYLRMLELRKAMIATGLTLSVCSVWGILEIFTTVPRLPVFWAFPMWAIGLGFGAVWNKLTLGDAGCA